MSTPSIYVWEKVITDYFPGLIVAFAMSEEDARDSIRDDSHRMAEEIDGVEPEVFDVMDGTTRHWLVEGGS